MYFCWVHMQKRTKKINVQIKIVASGCDQCVWAAGVVTGCGHWVWPVGVVTGCGRWLGH